MGQICGIKSYPTAGGDGGVFEGCKRVFGVLSKSRIGGNLDIERCNKCHAERTLKFDDVWDIDTMRFRSIKKLEQHAEN
jgi:hypothetical protein